MLAWHLSQVYMRSPMRCSMKTPDSNSSLLSLQLQALDDPALTVDDKLFFCRLACSDGFRCGWNVSDASWTQQTADSAARLHERGYLVLSLDQHGRPCVCRKG